MDTSFAHFESIIEARLRSSGNGFHKRMHEWNSLQVTMILGLIDQQYDVLVRFQDVMELDTLEEFHALVLKKLAV